MFFLKRDKKQVLVDCATDGLSLFFPGAEGSCRVPTYGARLTHTVNGPTVTRSKERAGIFVGFRSPSPRYGRPFSG